MRRHRHSRCQPLKMKKLRIVLPVFKGDNQILQDELFHCQVNSYKTRAFEILTPL